MSLATKKDITISSAESCTGGLISKYLTDLSGSSKFFNSSVIAYSNTSKIKLLNVSKKTLKEQGAVSKEVAIEMAKGLLEATNSTIAIAVTGIMELNKNEDNQKPTGVWICWCCADQYKTLYRDLEGNRTENRTETARLGISGLYDFIKEIYF
ncbi:MAG: CinA family protein [Pseudomonadota bacterium]|nr:CinA family protein [Pseudomonadota bacterium]